MATSFSVEAKQVSLRSQRSISSNLAGTLFGAFSGERYHAGPLSSEDQSLGLSALPLAHWVTLRLFSVVLGELNNGQRKRFDIRGFGC